jgi:hypothetical protein
MLYAAGLVLSAFAITPGQHQVLEILVGFGIAGTGFGVILAIVGRAASNEQRSLALGIATAAGSAGRWWAPCWPKAAGRHALAKRLPCLRRPHHCQPPAPAASAQPRPDEPRGTAGKPVANPRQGISRPLLHADLRRLLLLRLPAGLHHRAFPGIHHRGLRPDRARFGASRSGAHHDLGTRALSPSR